MVLVDTCVWIDFLRGRATPQVQLLEALLTDGDACLCEVTYAEICFGARDDRQFRKYEANFSQIPFLSLPEKWHHKIARMGHQLRLRGHRPYMADLQIALTTLANQASLLTTDKDFHPYRTLFQLDVLGGT